MHMAHYTAEITVSIRVETAFDYLSQFSSASQWDPSVVRTEDLSAGTPNKGSQFLIVAKFLGREKPLEYEIIEFDVPNKVVLKAQDKSIVSTDTITFTPSDEDEGVTTVRYDALLELKKPSRIGEFILGLLFKRLGDNATKGLTRELNKLGGKEIK